MTGTDLPPALVGFLREQADRQARLDCLHRCTRGKDDVSYIRPLVHSES